MQPFDVGGAALVQRAAFGGGQPVRVGLHRGGIGGRVAFGGFPPCQVAGLGAGDQPARAGYLHRFDIEHTYRFAKHGLGWDKAALRHPQQVARWTWLIIAAITQLRLARPAAEDHRQRWERRRKAGKLTPGRVRRDFGRLAALAGTAASAPKPSRAGPGRPKGRRSRPAPRHDVIKKTA